MNATLALKTMALIDVTIKADQGASFREWEGRVIPHLEDAFRGKDEGNRSHLGASLIGKECDRDLWYTFNWAQRAQFEARTLRLFNRGHLEEGRLIAMFLMIGCQFFQYDTNGKQFRISDAGGHFGGSGDGVVIGIPDLDPNTPCLAEFKTHSDKNFKKVSTEGVKSAKNEHWVQMQVYMRKMGLAVAIYCAVNKNDDDLYMEIINIEPIAGDFFIVRANRIIPLRVAPKKIAESTGAYQCKFCGHKPVCKLGAQPEKNCRTCEHSSVDTEKGVWWCDNEERRLQMLFPNAPERVKGLWDDGETYELTKQRQRMGCPMYEKNPTF